MKKVTTEQLASPESQCDPEVIAFKKQFEAASPLDEVVRLGAQQMLQAAIESEVDGCMPNTPIESMSRTGFTSMFAWKTRKTSVNACSC